ncbi:MAG TPA: type II secretion system protein [Patescibacteria group bacterium]|nr:type II secretion system protein [Patescibacteria group bacterium]
MRQRGFTLIELLVVIAIIGILAAVVLINVSAGRVKSRDARRLSDMHDIQTALEIYNNDCNQYPATWSLDESSGCPDGTTLSSFLPVLPKDPTDPQYTYNYTYDSDNQTYTMTFTLEDTAAGLPAGSHTLTPNSIQ